MTAGSAKPRVLVSVVVGVLLSAHHNTLSAIPVRGSDVDAAGVTEVRHWQERVLLPTQQCELMLRAEYRATTTDAQTAARFYVHSLCFAVPWQGEQALRALTRDDRHWFAISEDFSCQQLALVPQAKAGAQWQTCSLQSVPATALHRSLWGPVRVASAELADMQAAERQVLARVRDGQPYTQFTGSWSEQLWVERFCGRVHEIVNHFERHTACLATLADRLPTVFDGLPAPVYPPFQEAARCR